MKSTHQKIELAANIMIIIVAALLIFFLVQKYFLTDSSIPNRNMPIIGNKLSLPSEIDITKSDKNVMLVLSKGCHFCSESADFYKRLIENAKGKNIHIIAVLPQKKEEAEEYLGSLGISGIEVRQSQLDSINVSGTPTIIILNNKSEISDVWVGKLSSEKETEVFNKLSS